MIIHLLSLDLKRLEDLSRRTNGHLLLAVAQLTPNILDKLAQWHTYEMAVFEIRLVLGVVQLRLHSRGIDFYHFDIPGPILKLRSEGENKMVQRGLGGTVVGTALHGNQGHLGGGEGDGSSRLPLQVGNECLGEAHGRGIIRDQLLVENIHIHRLRLAEVKRALNAGVDKHAVMVGIFINHIRHELGDLLGSATCIMESCGEAYLVKLQDVDDL